jgi:hypothetical protein
MVAVIGRVANRRLAGGAGRTCPARPDQCDDDWVADLDPVDTIADASDMASGLVPIYGRERSAPSA